MRSDLEAVRLADPINGADDHIRIVSFSQGRDYTYLKSGLRVPSGSVAVPDASR